RAPVPRPLVDRRRPAADARRGRPPPRPAPGERADAGGVHVPGSVPAARYARRVTAERHADSASTGTTNQTRVSTLELFFDLVFVFTITQLTALYADELNRVGTGRILVMLIVIWWMYGAYAWLTNAVAPNSRLRRGMLLVGMGGFLAIALAIPD